MLDTQPDAACQISSISVMTDLASGAENVEGVLALKNFLNEIGHHMRQRQAHIPTGDIAVPNCPSFTDSDAIKWTGDRVRQAILLACSLREIFSGKFLKPVRR